MSLIDRYIARNFFSGYLILVAVGLGLYVLTDVLVNVDELFEGQPRTAAELFFFLCDYYGYNLPLYFAQLGGPLLAVAAAFTIGNLLRNNEMTPLIAAGVPLQRLAAPLLLCAALLIGVWVVNKELLIPRIAHKIARERDFATNATTEGLSMVRDANGALLTARRFEPRAGLARRVQIVVPDPTGGYRGLIDADVATWDPSARTWHLTRGRWLTRAADAARPIPLTNPPIDEYPYTLTPEELVLHQGSEWAELLSLRQMNRLVELGKLPNRATIIVNRHIRLTQPLIHLILVMLTLPMFLTREPTNVLAAGGKALLFGAGFLGLAFVAHGIVSEQGAALRAWAPILVFGPVAVLQLANVKT